MIFLGAMASTALNLLSSVPQLANSATATGTAASQNATAFLNQLGIGTSGSSATTSGSSAPATTPTAAGTNAGSGLFGADTLGFLLLSQSQQSGGVPTLSPFQSRLFNKLDSNGDGAISKSEFEAAFGPNANVTAADALFAKLDTNGNGTVDPTELAAALQNGRPHGHHHHRVASNSGTDPTTGATATTGSTGTAGTTGTTGTTGSTASALGPLASLLQTGAPTT